MEPTQPTVLSRSSPSTLPDLHACRIARPVFRKPTALHETVERRVRPVHRARGVPMLHRIDVDVVPVRMQVRLVPDPVFPVATLPNASLGLGQAPCEAATDSLTRERNTPTDPTPARSGIVG